MLYAQPRLRHTFIRCAMYFHSTLMGFSLTCLIVSKRFVNEIIEWLDYQSNISKILIIESLDNQAQVSVWLSKDLILESRPRTQ
jgi:hypothetical protein